MTDLSQIRWEQSRRGEWVASVYGAEVAVRRAGTMFTAHYGPDRWIIGGFGSRYKTRTRAQEVAVDYAIQAMSEERDSDNA